MSQFREGNFGRLFNHEGGMPVYRNAVRNPEGFGGFIGADGGVAAF